MVTFVSNTHGLSAKSNRLAVDSVKEMGLSLAVMVVADVQGTMGMPSSPYIDAYGRIHVHNRKFKQCRSKLHHLCR